MDDYKSVNERRAAHGLKPIKEGDVLPEMKVLSEVNRLRGRGMRRFILQLEYVAVRIIARN